MWLINTATLELQASINRPKNEYAILSHRWEEDEVTFQSWKERKDMQGQGYRKIVRFVMEAAARGFKYAWADTCCINKESSAELSEAINSMFKYYQDSAECLVYLSDLPGSGRTGYKEINDNSDDLFATMEALRDSAFTKKTVLFFDREWGFFGAKDKLFLCGSIDRITGIARSILTGKEKYSGQSIACRMSWAANRQTTRVEDIAYSLLGIFDTNMPLLYGEGESAFTRLQEEICKKTVDMSLFAWKTAGPDDLYSGLFAISPANFKHSAKVKAFHRRMQYTSKNEFAITNRGIRFDNPRLQSSRNNDVLLYLDCYDEITYQGLYISLCRTPDDWIRCRANVLIGSPTHLSEVRVSSSMFIRKLVQPGSLESETLFKKFLQFEFSPGISLISAEPSHLWEPGLKGFLGGDFLLGAVHILTGGDSHESEEFIIVCHTRPSIGYYFEVLAPWHEGFLLIKNLIGNKQLHIKQGYEKLGDLGQSILSYPCQWDERTACFQRLV